MRRRIILSISLIMIIHVSVLVLRAGQSATPPPPGDAARDEPIRVRVDGQIEAAKLIHQVRPKYPNKAKEKHIEDTVRFRAIIGRNGRIIKLDLISGHPLLADAAAKAVWKWRYEPTTFHGQPAEVLTEIHVVFALK